MNPQGITPGLLSNTFWSRKKIRDKSKERIDHLIHTEDKESFKWITALEESNEVLKLEVKAIAVCDIFDFYLSAIDMDRCRCKTS